MTPEYVALVLVDPPDVWPRCRKHIVITVMMEILSHNHPIQLNGT